MGDPTCITEPLSPLTPTYTDFFRRWHNLTNYALEKGLKKGSFWQHGHSVSHNSPGQTQ